MGASMFRFSSGADKSNSDNDNTTKGSNPGPSDGDGDNKAESSEYFYYALFMKDILNLGTYSDKDSDSSSVALIPIPERLKYEIRPHSSEINTIHISEDGQRFATGSVDKTIQVFSTQTGMFWFKALTKIS
jgi:WD40 repeat protein